VVRAACAAPASLATGCTPGALWVNDSLWQKTQARVGQKTTFCKSDRAAYYWPNP
jgi:hypothetical protein